MVVSVIEENGVTSGGHRRYMMEVREGDEMGCRREHERECASAY